MELDATPMESIDFLEKGKPIVPYGCVNIVHFLPGCEEHKAEWMEMNEEFVVLCWDIESLERVRKGTPVLCDLSNVSVGSADERLMYAAMLSYNFGGVILSRPLRCTVHMRNMLNRLPGTLMITFAAANGILDDVIISSAKIQACVSLFEYFAKARSTGKTFTSIFRDFITASMKASASGAIVCLSSNTLRLMTGQPAAEEAVDPLMVERAAWFDTANSMLRPVLPKETFSFGLLDLSPEPQSPTNPTEFTKAFESWLSNNRGRQVLTTETMDVCVMDISEFNSMAPVPMALRAANMYQQIRIRAGGFLVIGNCADRGASLDMLLQPQLKLSKAKSVYRTCGYAVWQMASE